MSRTRAVLVATCVALPACPPPAAFDITATGVTTGDTTGSTGSPLEPTTGDEPLPTTTLPPGTTTTGSTGPSGDTTSTGIPVDEPEVLDAEFIPDPLTSPGPIEVIVHTQHADAVSLKIDGSDPIELLPDGPDVFRTELLYYSAQANGEHAAEFIPWLEGQAGAIYHDLFTIDLPDGGGEVFWEASPALGKGHVAAVAVLPDGAIAEFGTLTEGTSRCYLRRRTAAGAWDMQKDVQLLAFTPCTATDLGIGPDGELYLLADREGSWWLGQSSSFGAAPINLRWGSPGEKAYALAMHPKKAAVCGTQPTPNVDIRAVAWIVGFDATGSTQQFDYTDIEENTFDETPRDCAFRKDTLVLTGAVTGQHSLKNPNPPILDRQFILEWAPNPGIPQWRIDGDPDAIMQSVGLALSFDDEGRTIVGSYTCGFPCGSTTSELRAYKQDGALDGTIKLAPEVAPPVDLAWSPAGYNVLVSGVKLDNWTSSYFVQAWNLNQYPAVWQYTKNVTPTLHVATSVAIGPFGQVYTGGVGSNGYPAVAFINP